MSYPSPEGPRWTGLSVNPLPIAEAHAFLADERAGGVCVFVGTARRWTEGQETVSLDYEAYETMAATELARLVTEAMSRWPVVRGVALHRLGPVAAGEGSVVVGAACPHRAEAFAACRWLLDTLKSEAPIWKREVFANGETAWVEPQG